MRRSYTLYKAFASNLEMPKPDGDKKKRNYTVFGMVAFFGIMVPVSVLVGYMTYALTELLYRFGGNTYALLSELHIISAFAMIFGLPLMFSVLFFASDLSFLTALPIEAHELYNARLFHTFKAENVMTSNVLFAMYIGYFVSSFKHTGASAFHPVGLLGAVTGFLGSLFIPLVYCSMLAMILMFFLKKVNRTDLYYLTSAVLFVFFTVMFLMSFKDYGKISTEYYLESLVEGDNSFISLCNIIFPTNMFSINAVGKHRVVSLIYTLVFEVVTYLLSVGLARAVYKEGLYAAAASVRGRAGQTSSGKVRKTGIFKALLSKEYKVLMRTSTYRMNCVFANLLWPAIAASLLISSRDNEIIGKIRSMLSSGDKKSIVIAFIVVAGISFIASGLNSIASTSFTREGAHIDLLKYLPAPLEKQIRAKGLIAILFTYIPLAVSLIPVAVMFGVPHLILPMLIASLLCVITATAIGVAMDSISPYTVWSDELSALRGNLNCFFNLAAELIIAGLTGLISYGLFILTSSDVITVTVSMVVLILMAATGVIQGFKIARKNIAES
jgi:ABC-2 type transport system permease protein